MTTGLVILLSLLLLAALLAPAGLRRLFRPSRAPGTSPDELGLAAEDVSFATVRGKRLSAWFIAPDPAPGPAVVVLHGWGSSAAELLPLAAPLHRAGLGVLLLDARCHGRSDDDDFASMPRFAEDLDHALDWLKARPEVDPTRTAAIGHSVGGAAVILAASRRDDLRAAVAVAAFAHPRWMMRRWLGAFRIPYPILGWWVLRHVERAIGHRYDDIAAVTVVDRIRCPLLLAHGTDDPQVPFADARAILAARGGASVELLPIDGFGHGEPEGVPRLVPGLMDFLSRAL
ncbi:MAG: alpha/beta fold hydrolase [Pseudomonadota bacterium]